MRSRRSEFGFLKIDIQHTLTYSASTVSLEVLVSVKALCHTCQVHLTVKNCHLDSKPVELNHMPVSGQLKSDLPLCTIITIWTWQLQNKTWPSWDFFPFWTRNWKPWSPPKCISHSTRDQCINGSALKTCFYINCNTLLDTSRNPVCSYPREVIPF